MKRLSYVVLASCLAGCGTSGTAPTSHGGSDKQTAASPAAESPSGVPTSAGPDQASEDVRLSIESYDGILDQIARHRGKVVVMDAWSTSCPPCLKEFHNLVDLHRQYGPERVACVSLSFDYEGIGAPEEQRERVLKFLRAEGATFDNLMSNDESDVLYRKFKLAAVPAVFVYDQAGNLRKRFDNEKAQSAAEAFTYEQVTALVADLLAEIPSQSQPASP